MSWDGILYGASYGGVPVHMVSSEIDAGNRIALHEGPNRHGARTENNGERPWTCSADLIFVGDEYLERYEEFREKKSSPDSLAFVHPLEGTKYCQVLDFAPSDSAGVRDARVVRCTFVEDASYDWVAVSPRPVEPGQAVEGANVAAARLSEAIADAGGEPSDVVTDGPAAARRWATDTSLTPAQIQSEMLQMSHDISNLSNELLIGAPGTWELTASIIRMQSALRLVAETAARNAKKLIEVRIAKAVPVVVLAQRTYGGGNAVVMADRIIRLNPKIKNPNRIPAGSVLTIETPKDVQKGTRVAR